MRLESAAGRLMVAGKDAVAGAAAGCVGSVLMITLMKPGLARWLDPSRRPREFVPRQVVRWLDGRTTLVSLRTRRQETSAAALAHIGYGAAMGAAYGVLGGAAGGRGHSWAGELGRAAGPSAAGALWGVAVWAVGYQGWMPAVGVRRATTDHPPRQWPLPIANHVLFGVVVAHVFDRTRARGNGNFNAGA